MHAHATPLRRCSTTPLGWASSTPLSIYRLPHSPSIPTPAARSITAQRPGKLGVHATPQSYFLGSWTAERSRRGRSPRGRAVTVVAQTLIQSPCHSPAARRHILLCQACLVREHARVHAFAPNATLAPSLSRRSHTRGKWMGEGLRRMGSRVRLGVSGFQAHAL